MEVYVVQDKPLSRAVVPTPARSSPNFSPQKKPAISARWPNALAATRVSAWKCCARCSHRLSIALGLLRRSR